MPLVDSSALLKHPHLATYQGPAPWPVWQVFFLDPVARARRRYAVPDWTANMPTARTRLVLEPEEPEFCTVSRRVSIPQPPSGYFSVWPLGWDWQAGFDRSRHRSIIVPIQSAAQNSTFASLAPFPYLAIELDGSRLYWASLPAEPPQIVRERAKAFAIRERRLCYLALHHRRAIRFDIDGTTSPVAGVPERSLVTSVPLYEWSCEACPRK